jgi:peptidylprolyl isomerase
MQITALLLAAVVQTNLQIEVLQLGSGPASAEGDQVTVEYTGSFPDGKVFDSSKGKPTFTITLGEKRVIAGWEEGLLGMRKGAKRKLTIPPALAYGEKGAGEVIPPNATLAFEVELLYVVKKGEKKMIEIEEIKPGEGPEVKAGDTVEMHYTGTFLNGTKFDSSRDRNETFSFKVDTGQVIKGFDMAVTGMKKGGVRKVTIPPELGYGERGAGGVIPPNTPLQFEVEVVSIK